MTERAWAIDAGVARELSEALGWSADDGVGALAVRMPERVPMGSTAKLASMAAGDVPPGADVDGLARTILDHQLALAVAPDGGAPSPSWSCWVAATVTAALLDAADVGPVAVAAVRRIDERAPVADLHSAVVVEAGSAETWVCDPYFGLALPLPLEPGATVAAVSGLVRGSVTRADDDGRGWTSWFKLSHWDGEGLGYRLLAPAMDAGDVRALATISVTYTGVPSRPYARLHVDGGVLDAYEMEDGTGRVSHWTDEPSVGESTDLPSWVDANAEFARRTGTRVI